MTRTALHARCAIVVPCATMRVQNCVGSLYSATKDQKSSYKSRSLTSRARLRNKTVAVAESAPQADTRSVCVIRTTVWATFQPDTQRRAGLSSVDSRATQLNSTSL